MRKQYRHQTFQQKQGNEKRTPKSTEVTTTKHDPDYIAEHTNKWSIVLRRTRALTRWLELHGTHALQLAWTRGWMSSLQLEHELANLATK
jgi:hypothetical protein